MSLLEGTPLEDVKELSAELISKLKESWITTVEQVISISATQEGLRSLARHLSLSEQQAIQLVKIARSYLSQEVIAEIEKPINTRDFGTGGVKPKSD